MWPKMGVKESSADVEVVKNLKGDIASVKVNDRNVKAQPSENRIRAGSSFGSR